MSGLFAHKKTHFKGPSLRPKKSRKTPERDYTGASVLTSQNVTVSHDQRRVYTSRVSVQVVDEDDPRYEEMILDEEGYLHEEHTYTSLADTSADRVVTKPCVVYVSQPLLLTLQI